MRVPFNARTIASELSIISAAELDLDDGEITLAPYLHSVFMTGFRCNLDGKHPGSLVDRLLWPEQLYKNPFQRDNNDISGITVFDVTDISNVRYCFAFVKYIDTDDDEIESFHPLTGEQYLRCYDDFRDPTIQIESTLQILRDTPLIDLDTLADTWPGDFGYTYKSIKAGPETGTPSKAIIPSLTTLSISTVVGELLDPEAEKADGANLTRAALDTLRSGFSRQSRLNHNGAILLVRLLNAEYDNFIDLKPFLRRGLLIKESFVAVLRDAAPSGTVLDISGCDWIDEGILRKALLSLSKIERVIAFACPLLDDLEVPLSVSCLLTTGQLRFGPTFETLDHDYVMTEGTAPSLSVFVYTGYLAHQFFNLVLDPEKDARRYGLELAHFSVGGVLQSMATLAKFLETSCNEFSDVVDYPFRGCFQSLGGGELGAFPRKIPSARVPRAKPEHEESIQMKLNGDTEPTDRAVAPVPRSPGWTLVWDTRGVTPQMKRVGERYGQKRTIYEAVGNPDLCAPRYGFVQWTAESEAGAEAKLVPVQCVSAREWVKTLAPGHGRISEEELETFERAMAEHHVRTATLEEVMAAASWPVELWESLDEISKHGC
ncbi:hypothetical protein BKA62DRAFT_832256 [Auriculariales sp. MPI-PUGE-AT-0066]|nr:hypothetical protein BKA62DRAFT_832256 [Auriculariales sp. MPI-PUGE-AT-0066]